MLTRTIGDPSTGTHTTVDDTAPLGVQDQPPALTTDSSSSSTTVRPRLSQLPKPRTFILDGPVSPAASSTASSTQAGTSPGSIAEGPLRVLVVDDDPLTRKLMSRMLTRIGCKVATAEHGEIALDMMTDTVEYGDSGLRWQTSAILALQEATEAFLVHMFEDA